MKKMITFMFVGIFLLTACGPEPEPTMSAADVQGTAVAAAWTMVAETQAAIPTATPIPPTETPSPTPLPTNTVPPLEVPTESSLLAQPTTAPAQTGDICNDLNHILPGQEGPMTTIKIVNEQNMSATISIYLNETVFGECGYRSYTLNKKGSTVQTLPQGCYSAWAWGDDGKNKFGAEGYGLCVNNADKWTMVIRGERIIMLPP